MKAACHLRVPLKACAGCRQQSGCFKAVGFCKVQHNTDKKSALAALIICSTA